MEWNVVKVEAKQLETASTRTTKKSRVRTSGRVQGGSGPSASAARERRSVMKSDPVATPRSPSPNSGPRSEHPGGNSTPMSTENMLYRRCGILDSGTSHGTRSILCRPISRACHQTGRARRFGTVEQFRFEDGKALDGEGHRNEPQMGDPVPWRRPAWLKLD